MTHWIRTQNSLYEVDLDRRMVRRRSGISPPTARQGDGAWKPFTEISPWPPVVGVPVLVVWEVADTSEGPVLRTTELSAVVACDWN